MTDIIVSKSTGEFVPKNKWIASLSNGETIFEDNLPNLPASWNRLRDYINHHNLSITKLRVQLGPLEISLPPNQHGYVQKKKMISTGSWSKLVRGVGYVQDGKALIHYVGEDRSSQTLIENDPGEPWTIYSNRKQDG